MSVVVLQGDGVVWLVEASRSIGVAAASEAEYRGLIVVGGVKRS